MQSIKALMITKFALVLAIPVDSEVANIQHVIGVKFEIKNDPRKVAMRQEVGSKVMLAGALTLAMTVRDKTLEPADTSSVQDEHATPGRVIVLSRGRGGSTVLSQTIASFSKSDPKALHNELLGGNPQAMARQTNPRHVIKSWFEQQSRSQPDARLIGFKLKPCVVFNLSDAYNEAWDWVAYHNISVVWMTRNLLDVLTSEAKHRFNNISPHCHDEACTASHQVRVSLDQMLNSKNTTLVERLQAAERKYETDLEAYLIEKRVRYRRLRFEDIFEVVAEDEGERSLLTLRLHADHALSEWNALFAFLGLDPVTTYEDIRATANELQVSTMPASQCDAFEDPSQVQKALKGSPYEGLLRCTSAKKEKQYKKNKKEWVPQALT